MFFASCQSLVFCVCEGLFVFACLCECLSVFQVQVRGVEAHDLEGWIRSFLYAFSGFGQKSTEFTCHIYLLLSFSVLVFAHNLSLSFVVRENYDCTLKFTDTYVDI